MSTSAINTRLALYVGAAMLTQYIGDAESLRNADLVGISIFVAKVALAGVIVWRAFIDQSKSIHENPAKDSEGDLPPSAPSTTGDR